MFELKTQHAALRAELEQALADVLSHGQFTLGPDVEAFERELAEALGIEHVIAMSSGTDALLVSLMALGVGAGDEVVTTPFSFFATAGVIHRVGARPIFADIEPEGFGIDPAALEAAITPKTRAAIPVHLYGQCAEMDPILEICSKRGVHVIEDAAQAVGARYGGRPAGGMGRLGALSFYPTKNLGGLGDAGAVTTTDGELARGVRCLRVHGQKSASYLHEEIGTNARMDAFQGATLRVKLRRLAEYNEARRRNAERYGKLFEDAGLDRVLTLPRELPGRRHIYHQYVIRLPAGRQTGASARDALREHLAGSGVGCAVFYPLPLHLQPCFAHLGYKEGAFPEAERASLEVLALPMYPELTSDQQAQVVGAIGSFYPGTV